jgi:hypothetical protein
VVSKKTDGNSIKKKTLEQEAQEFTQKPILSGEIPSRDYFAGAALSGLLASGVRGRSDEIVNQAFCYSCLMLDYKKQKDKSS